MTRTSIEWTDYSWNPIRARVNGKTGWHCEKVSPGCANCYAERVNIRLGTGAKYTKLIHGAGAFLDEKTLVEPLRWRKPRKVFVCSMTDLFGEWVPDEWIDRVFAAMALSPQHTFQVLTKRADRLPKYVNDATRYRVRKLAKLMGMKVRTDPFWIVADLFPWPLPNVWLGVSVEDQRRLDERVSKLLATPAAVRLVSVEPLLGPLDMRPALFRGSNPAVRMCPHCLFFSNRVEDSLCPNDGASMGPVLALDWVIVGGESGPGARPMDIAWARDIVRQCKGAGVACFVKQLGRYVLNGPLGREMGLRHAKGGDPAEWPEDLRVREWPR